MFMLPPLPYSYDALEPAISARTMRAHHDHHHLRYVDTLNKLVRHTDYENLSLEAVITRSALKRDHAVFNNAGQHYNHSFFWKSLSPRSMKAHVPASLKHEFKELAMGVFGSGWVWLVDNGGPRWVTTHDGVPVLSRYKPVLVVDVWEHAYYLDREYDREAYLDAIWPRLRWDVFSL